MQESEGRNRRGKSNEHADIKAKERPGGEGGGRDEKAEDNRGRR